MPPCVVVHLRLCASASCINYRGVGGFCVRLVICVSHVADQRGNKPETHIYTIAY